MPTEPLLRGRLVILRPRPPEDIASFKALLKNPRSGDVVLHFNVEHDDFEVGILSFPVSPASEAEILFTLNSPEIYGGRGFMTEAVGLVAAWAFNAGIRRITALVGVGNIASQKVFGRNGFNIENEEEQSRTYLCEKFAPKKNGRP